MKTALAHPEPNKDFDSFKECAEWLSSERPVEIRKGQFLYNHLREQHPAFAEALISHPNHNPFYDDARIPNFWAFIRENWYLTAW